MRGQLRRLVLGGLFLAAGLLAGLSLSSAPATAKSPAAAQSCSAGYVDAIINGVEKCLRNGEFCSAPDESQYEHYGFTCVDGHLETYAGSTTTTTTTSPTTTAPVTTTVPATTTAATTTTETTTAATTTTGIAPVTSGGVRGPGTATPNGSTLTRRTVRLKARTNSSGCHLGPLPDRRCSPGAIYPALTKSVLCSSSFHTSSIRNVPESEKHKVEVEYGMTPKSYGSSLEIDHIVSLELGGSNDIANLYPEKSPGYHLKDRLENKLHKLVCSGAMTLHAAQVGIAGNWEALYKNVFGTAPGV